VRTRAVLAALVGVIGATVFAGAAAGQASPTEAASEQPSDSSFDTSPTLRAIPDGPGRPVAELQGLDKVTARTRRFIAPVGQSTTFGTLAITVGDCLVNTPDAPPEAAAYLTIVDHKPGQPEQKLFAGWMFASSPSISAMDDGVYDVRVLACTREQGSSPAKSP
jgi:hypothetical protein